MGFGAREAQPGDAFEPGECPDFERAVLLTSADRSICSPGTRPQGRLSAVCAQTTLLPRWPACAFARATGVLVINRPCDVQAAKGVPVRNSTSGFVRRSAAGCEPAAGNGLRTPGHQQVSAGSTGAGRHRPAARRAEHSGTGSSRYSRPVCEDRARRVVRIPGRPADAVPAVHAEAGAPHGTLGAATFPPPQPAGPSPKYPSPPGERPPFAVAASAPVAPSEAAGVRQPRMAGSRPCNSPLYSIIP